MARPILTLALGNLAIALACFALVWAICVRVRNYSYLDVVWTLSIGLLAVVDGLLGPGDIARRALFSLVGLAWSLRLGLFVLARVMRHHPVEDKRYRTFRERWRTPAAFLAFFELQALIAAIFAVPFLLAAVAPDPHMSGLEWIGLLAATGGLIGEAIADAQSAAFKRRPDSTRRILDAGLWRYSRHPNYFFEIITWMGFALAALPLPFGPLAIACPLLISYFLLRVTGIPLTEKHSIESHGDAYRAYQRRTNAIIPWTPKP